MAENFLEGNKHDVTTTRWWSLLNHLCWTLFPGTVSSVVPVFRQKEYLFLPLQTIIKAQMMMQMSAMQTPTVIPVIDFWSKW